jgi:BirA family biotin operon repressor/biotin-[acetyl-CoA-carboxylase] ligase
MTRWTPRDTARARALRGEATQAERTLWQYLSKSQTGAKFSRQMPVGPFFADFLCRELSLVVELDGFSHDCVPEGDERRDAWMAAHGFTVLRFLNEDVHTNGEGVVAAIRLEIARLRRLKGSTHP